MRAILLLSMLVLNFGAFALSQPGASDIFTANRWLARSINIAFTFDAPKEGAWGHTLSEDDFATISKAGFTALRLPITWVARMDSTAVGSATPSASDPSNATSAGAAASSSTAAYAIDPTFLARIDWAIKMALKYKLAIVLDNHLDNSLMADPTKYKDRFLSLWKQLSAHYKDYPQQVMFEVMAEPNGKLNPLWNDYFADALAIIRQTNPTRPVIVGPMMYNMAPTLSSLKLPVDDHYLIVTIHYYMPVKFTMQGEKWFPMGKPMEWIGTQWTGTDAETAPIKSTMSAVADWAKQQNRPVFLGEFGAGNQADTASKARYFRTIVQTAELNGFSWGVFSYTVGFSLYDQTKKQWISPLLNALIPQ